MAFVSPYVMTDAQAKAILDAAREGRDVGPSAIFRALHVTGDLGAHEELRGQGVDSPLQEEDWRGWIRSRAVMVGKSKE